METVNIPGECNRFIKGMDLCRSFFNHCAKAIIEDNFPGLKYSAGLIGYGSDVLGYDDAVSTDHMWGPRFYLFLSRADIGKKYPADFLLTGYIVPKLSPK